METQSISLSPEDIQKLEKIEQSITYWARKHSSHTIKADQAKGQLVGMYGSREHLFSEIVQKNDLPEGARIVEISESGDVMVALPEDKDSSSGS